MLGAAFADTGSLPAFLQTQLIFPYEAGQRFVESLRERAGGRWTLVDLADRTRPPASTEQVMHPDAYIDVDAPRAGAAAGRERARRRLEARGGRHAGASCRRARCWPRRAAAAPRTPPRAGAATATSCGARGACDSPPCRDGDVLVMRWRWDTPRDEREFAAKLRQWVKDGLGDVGGGVAVARPRRRGHARARAGRRDRAADRRERA